jgi:hypothetical protein
VQVTFLTTCMSGVFTPLYTVNSALRYACGRLAMIASPLFSKTGLSLRILVGITTHSCKTSRLLGEPVSTCAEYVHSYVPDYMSALNAASVL